MADKGNAKAERRRVPTSGGGIKEFGKDLVRSAKSLNTKMGNKAKKLQEPKQGVMDKWLEKRGAKK